MTTIDIYAPLITRLRDECRVCGTYLCCEAADAIESLTRERDALTPTCCICGSKVNCGSDACTFDPTPRALVEWLRESHECSAKDGRSDFGDAADAIESLTRERDAAVRDAKWWHTLLRDVMEFVDDLPRSDNRGRTAAIRFAEAMDRAKAALKDAP